MSELCEQCKQPNNLIDGLSEEETQKFEMLLLAIALDRVSKENDRLRSKNAKLRELVYDTLCATNPDPHSLFWEHNDPYSFWANFRMRARKLGIEVPS